MRIAVLGMGYVGCVTAACLAEAGHTVVGIDPAEEKVAALNEGKSPLVEPGLGELVANHIRWGGLRAATSLKSIEPIDVAIVCVGTPSGQSGQIDLSFMEAVCRELGELIRMTRSSPTIVIRSTLLPGTTETKVLPWLETASGKREGQDFSVAFCPEFLREASAIKDFQSPPFNIVGLKDPSSGSLAESLFAAESSESFIVPFGVAESVKYASNAFHAAKVVFANEIERYCTRHGIDAKEVMSIFAKDRSLNISAKYLKPGSAFGGSCLPKDVRAILFHADESNVDVPLLQSIIVSNDIHVDRIVQCVQSFDPAKVAILGLTFKPGTDDLRESPSVRIAAALQRSGIHIRIFDPLLRPTQLIGNNLEYAEALLPDIPNLICRSVEESLAGAEVIVLATNDESACEAALQLAPTVPVVDTEGVLPIGADILRREVVPTGSRSACVQV